MLNVHRVAGFDQCAGVAVSGSAGILSQTPGLPIFGLMSAGYQLGSPTRSAGMFSTTTGSQSGWLEDSAAAIVWCREVGEVIASSREHTSPVRPRRARHDGPRARDARA